MYCKEVVLDVIVYGMLVKVYVCVCDFDGVEAVLDRFVEVKVVSSVVIYSVVVVVYCMIGNMLCVCDVFECMFDVGLCLNECMFVYFVWGYG